MDARYAKHQYSYTAGYRSSLWHELTCSVSLGMSYVPCVEAMGFAARSAVRSGNPALCRLRVRHCGLPYAVRWRYRSSRCASSAYGQAV